MFGAYSQPSAIMKEWTQKPTIFLNSEIHGLGAKPIAIRKKVKFDEARCRFSTFLRLQGDHHCACAQKVVSIFIFFQELSNKKNLGSTTKDDYNSLKGVLS